MDLETLQLAKKYTNKKVESAVGITVVANPTLAGTEPNLNGLQVGNKKYKVPAGGGSAPQYISLSFYEDGQTGTLSDDQVEILKASEINYIWLNGMHRLDFRYKDDNNNKATYSAVDTSSDGNKTHSIEINLSTKAFKVYHRTLQEKLTAGANITISGNTISAAGTTYTAGTNIKIENNKISAEAGQLALEGTSGTLTAEQLALLANKSVNILRDTKVHSFSSSTSTSSGELRTYALIIDNNVCPMYHYILVNMLSGVWNAYTTNLQDKLTAGANITIDETTHTISATGGGGAGYFLAEYNKTTFADVLAAYNAGKIIDLKATMTGIGDVILHLKFVQLTDSTPTNFNFGQLILDTASMTLSIDASGWHSTQVDLERELVAGSAIGFDSEIGTARTIGVKYDNNTIKVNSDGKLYTTTAGTSVIANPTLTGDEESLNSIQIGDTKYSNLNYHPFPSSFVINKTLIEFGESVIKYDKFATGCVWYGGLNCTDLPGNLMQVECKVTALRDKTDFVRNIAVVEIFSSNVPPFYWHYNTDSWDERTGFDDWKYSVSIDGSKFDKSAKTTDIYEVKAKKGQYDGWEFYVDKPTDISGKVDKPNEPVAGQGVNVPYYFDVNYSADKATVKDYTIDLLDKSKAPQQFSIDINSATQATAGLMSAADKKNVDEMLPEYPTDTTSEYVLALKYENGAWKKYWKETINRSDLVDKGMVDYMVIKE